MAAKRNRDKGWTAKELLVLERMRMNGWSVARIAAELGRPFFSVKGRLQVMGIYLPPHHHLGWLDKFRTGAKDAELAAEMNVSQATVRTRRSRLRALGYDFPDRRRREYK